MRERSDHDDVCFPNPLEPYAPLIINVALTGVIPSKAMTPHVPLTPAEIVADAVRCHDVGAAVVHVHARDRDGRPTYDAEVFAEIISGIHRERPQLIVCATTSGRRYGEFEQRSAVLELDGDARPDLASLTTGSLNFPDGPSVNTRRQTFRKICGLPELAWNGKISCSINETMPEPLCIPERDSGQPALKVMKYIIFRLEYTNRFPHAID